VPGNADAYEGAAGGDRVRNGSAAGQQKGKRAGPEGGCKGSHARFKSSRDAGECGELCEVGYVDDERVPGGALLGGEDAGDSGW